MGAFLAPFANTVSRGRRALCRSGPDTAESIVRVALPTHTDSRTTRSQKLHFGRNSGMAGRGHKGPDENGKHFCLLLLKRFSQAQEAAVVRWTRKTLRRSARSY